MVEDGSIFTWKMVASPRARWWHLRVQDGGPSKEDGGPSKLGERCMVTAVCLCVCGVVCVCVFVYLPCPDVPLPRIPPSPKPSMLNPMRRRTKRPSGARQSTLSVTLPRPLARRMCSPCFSITSRSRSGRTGAFLSHTERAAVSLLRGLSHTPRHTHQDTPTHIQPPTHTSNSFTYTRKYYKGNYNVCTTVSIAIVS
jgi:hypothetical protein